MSGENEVIALNNVAAWLTSTRLRDRGIAAILGLADVGHSSVRIAWFHAVGRLCACVAAYYA